MKKVSNYTRKKFSSLFGTVFDKKHQYVLVECAEGKEKQVANYMQENGFSFRFFDGCFYPYLTTGGEIIGTGKKTGRIEVIK